MKWLRSIRTVFILAVLIPLLVAVLVFTTINNAGSQRAVEKVLEELQGTILEIVKNELNQKFSQAIVMNEKHLQSLERGLFTLDTPEGREPYFVTALENVPDAAMTFIGLRDGRFYGARRMTTGEIQVARNNASTGGASEYYQVNEKGIGTSFVQKFANFDPRTRPWYQNAANREEAVFSDIYSHFVFREPTITASLPIYQDGELAGVFGVDFLMTWLGETLRQLPIGPNGLVFIVDQKGDLVASSSGEAIFRVSETGAKTIPMEEAENLIIRTASLIYTDGNPDTLSRLIIGGKEYLLIKEDYRLLGLEWDVYVALASEDFLAGMLETRASVNRNMGFFILGFLIFAFWFSGWLTSPIIALSASARKLKGGVYEPVPFMDRQDELGQLTSSYNEMAEQLTSLVSHLESQVQERTRDLQKALDEKSEFLATMSHEIRSPMNVVMGMADLVMDSELQPVQREYVQLIKDAAKRLLQVINEVLDFSKIEAGKLKLNPAPFSFSA